MILEGLRTLTSYRKMACGKETTSNADFQEHIDWCALLFPCAMLLAPLVRNILFRNCRTF